MPVYCMVPWTNPEELRNKYLSSAIWLFSGMTKHDFFIDVVDEGQYLLYEVRWCEFMSSALKIYEIKLICMGRSL